VRAACRVVYLALRSAHRTPALAGLLATASIVGVATTLLIPAALGRGIDAVVHHGDPGPALIRLSLLFAATAAADVTAAAAEGACTATATASLRRRGMVHALRLGLPGQTLFPPGDLASRLMAGTSDAASVLAAGIGLACGLATSCGGIVALGLIDWHLCVTFLIAVLPIVAIVTALMGATTDLIGRYRRVQGIIASRLTDALGGTRTIRAARTTAREVERVLAPLRDLSQIGHAMWMSQRRGFWQVTLVATLADVAVLGVAGVGVSTGRISAGSFVAAAGYGAIALGIVSQIDSLVRVGCAVAGGRRITEVLDEPAPCEHDSGDPLPAGPGAVSLRDVTVKAIAGEVLLDQLTLRIPPGMLLAVVGRSGAGKTTLAHVLGRLREPDAGEVRLDGVALASVATESLRSAVAYAFERPALLGDTIHDAIAYGCPGLSRARIEMAAAMAQADGFIRRLPAGYDTRLADAPLSGGEAQRLGLARAFAGNARLLVLDDATSNLDTATEALVSEALTNQLCGRTRVVVAHRPSTAARADAVAWIEGGTLRGLARHQELWADPGYRAVFQGPAS